MNPKIEELIGYTTHDSRCIRATWCAGRPTKDGYEEQFSKTWYESRPVDRTPKCNCGLDDLIKEITDVKD